MMEPLVPLIVPDFLVGISAVDKPPQVTDESIKDLNLIEQILDNHNRIRSPSPGKPRQETALFREEISLLRRLCFAPEMRSRRLQPVSVSSQESSCFAASQKLIERNEQE
jgi:hypothetical protein